MYKALPCSDYYGSSVAMPDFQCLTHSPCGRSGLGNLQLTEVVGKCELSDMLSFRYYWFSSVPYELIDNPLKGIYFQRYSYHRFQTSFLCPHVTEVWNSHSTNLVLSSYSLNLAVQSCSIVFEQLSAFLPCYFPVQLSPFG